MYKSICIKYGQEVPESKWTTIPRCLRTTELRSCDQPAIEVVDKLKRAGVVDVAIPSDIATLERRIMRS